MLFLRHPSAPIFFINTLVIMLIQNGGATTPIFDLPKYFALNLKQNLFPTKIGIKEFNDMRSKADIIRVFIPTNVPSVAIAQGKKLVMEFFDLLIKKSEKASVNENDITKFITEFAKSYTGDIDSIKDISSLMFPVETGLFSSSSDDLRIVFMNVFVSSALFYFFHMYTTGYAMLAKAGKLDDIMYNEPQGSYYKTDSINDVFLQGVIGNNEVKSVSKYLNSDLTRFIGLAQAMSIKTDFMKPEIRTILKWNETDENRLSGLLSVTKGQLKTQVRQSVLNESPRFPNLIGNKEIATLNDFSKKYTILEYIFKKAYGSIHFAHLGSDTQKDKYEKVAVLSAMGLIELLRLEISPGIDIDTAENVFDYNPMSDLNVHGEISENDMNEMNIMIEMQLNNLPAIISSLDSDNSNDHTPSAPANYNEIVTPSAPPLSSTSSNPPSYSSPTLNDLISSTSSRPPSYTSNAPSPLTMSHSSALTTSPSSSSPSSAFTTSHSSGTSSALTTSPSSFYTAQSTPSTPSTPAQSTGIVALAKDAFKGITSLFGTTNENTKSEQIVSKNEQRVPVEKTKTQTTTTPLISQDQLAMYYLSKSLQNEALGRNSRNKSVKRRSSRNKSVKKRSSRNKSVQKKKSIQKRKSSKSKKSASKNKKSLSKKSKSKSRSNRLF